MYRRACIACLFAVPSLLHVVVDDDKLDHIQALSDLSKRELVFMSVPEAATAHFVFL
jgi:hypothetical protein